MSETVSIQFSSPSLPKGVMGLPNAQSTKTADRYEAAVSVSGAVSGQFRGSIFPDNMLLKGRVLNGTYQLYLGFHKLNGHKPTKSDLVARINGARAALILNRGNSVPVKSLSPTKTTSQAIHIHNGYNTWKFGVPMSEGCLLIAPAQWSAFISAFIKAFPDVSSWSSNGGNLGLQIGTVTVTSPDIDYSKLVQRTDITGRAAASLA